MQREPSDVKWWLTSVVACDNKNKKNVKRKYNKNIPSLSEEAYWENEITEYLWKCGKIRTPFPQRKVIDNLMNNETTHIMKQKKGRKRRNKYGP